MMGREYIALAASLPHLPYFERATRLPITERALAQRLRSLDEDDYAQLAMAVALLRWKRHAIEEQTERIEAQYRGFMARATHTGLREYVDWRIAGRSAIAALRLKARGQLTAPQEAWGAGRLVRAIERNWVLPDVGLSGLFPWLQEASRLLSAGEALALERLQMSVVWRRLAVLGEIDPFGFEFVTSYVFKWDIIKRWIAYAPQTATDGFKRLIEEAIRDYRLVDA